MTRLVRLIPNRGLPGPSGEGPGSPHVEDRGRRACGEGDPMQADGVLLEDGVIHTLDPDRPRAAAVAVRQDRIVMVGDGRDLRAAHPRFARVPLDGRAVVPAFTDSHIHLAACGLAL